MGISACLLGFCLKTVIVKWRLGIIICPTSAILVNNMNSGIEIAYAAHFGSSILCYGGMIC